MPWCYLIAPAHPQAPSGEPTAAQGQGNPSHELPTTSGEAQSHLSFAQLTWFFITKLLFYLLPHESFHPSRLTGPDWRGSINFSRTGELQQEYDTSWCILLTGRLKGNRNKIRWKHAHFFSTETQQHSAALDLLPIPCLCCHFLWQFVSTLVKLEIKEWMSRRQKSWTFSSWCSVKTFTI